MSLLELIAQRAPNVADGLQLSDLLAETALVALAEGHDVQSRPLIARHFARVLLDESTLNADQLVGNLLEHNVPLSRILTQYLPEVARLLGKQWETDEITFAQVTQACGHLLRLVHDLGAPHPLHPVPPVNRPRILLVRPEAETHFLGMMIAAAELRRDGWLVKVELSGASEAIVHTLSTDVFDVVGLTVGTDRAVDSAKRMIKTIRETQQKAPLAIGGRIVEAQSALVSSLDVDIPIAPSEDIGAQLRQLLPAKVG